MRAFVIVLLCLLVGQAAQAGQNAGVSVFLEFDNGENRIDPSGPTSFTITIYLSSFGPGGGTTGVEFMLDRTFGGSIISQANLLGGGSIGGPESGWSLAASGCVQPGGDGRVAVAEVEYYYDGTPGTIEILPHPTGESRAVFDCSAGQDDWCVRIDPPGHGGVCEAAPPGHCSFTPTGYVFWHCDNEGAPTGWESADEGVFLATPHFHLDSYMAYAGSYSWWCGAFEYDGDGGYGNYWRDFLWLPEVDVYGYAYPLFSFCSRGDTEPELDVLRVQAKSSGTFVDMLAPLSGTWGWEQSLALDLSIFDDPVSIRFFFESNGSLSDQDGGYMSQGGACAVDDIVVYDYYTTEVIFEDDAESGGLCTPSTPNVVVGDYWHVTTAYSCAAYSGWYCWWCGDDADTNQMLPGPRINSLTTPVINICEALTCTVAIAAHIHLPDADDMLLVEGTVDGGDSWFAFGTYNAVCPRCYGWYLLGGEVPSGLLPATELRLKFTFLADDDDSGPSLPGRLGPSIDDIWVYGALAPLPEIDVAPDSLSLQSCSDGSASDTLTIGNCGAEALLWSIAASSGWVTAVPDSGVVPPLASQDVQIIADAVELELGEHHCGLLVASNDFCDPVVDVPIMLTAVPCGPPRLVGVTDVLGDQGRQVRLRWERCEYDAPGDTIDVTAYGVYRREDERTERSPDDRRELASVGGGDPRLDGWDYVMTVPARGDLYYQCVAPTLCDSTADGGVCWSVFFLSAMTPDPLVYFDSPADSGYSVDNTAPSPPRNASASGDSSLVIITWEPNEEPDLDHYAVYRDTTEDFMPGTPIGCTLTEFYEDAHPPAALQWWYKVTACDVNGNESKPSPPIAAAATGVPGGSPVRFWLGPAVPNPFNATTEISYWVPGGDEDVDLELSIFDVSGRTVRVLEHRTRGPGRYTVPWDGRDDDSDAVASGVYFYRLEAGDYVSTRKMVLLK